jgi:energy-coupling factor transport system ATP-binding protein
MIEFRDVSVRFEGRLQPAIDGATFVVPEGELVLVVGPTGSGKTTLLRCVNGLVPHFTGGRLAGHVVVDGRDTRAHRPRDLADLVGVVGQDPVAAFVTDTVEEELAYGMETMGLDPASLRRRVEETLDVLGLADVRHRNLRDLSGGQQQRVAIGAVFAAGPRILVLDEPTSALDPVAAEEVLAALHRLVYDLGVTVVLAEHRLERVIHHADQVLLVRDGRVSTLLAPADAMTASTIFPPVIGLGRLARWTPLPLSVRDARRQATSLREALANAIPLPVTRPSPTETHLPARTPGPPAEARHLVVQRGLVTALRGLSLALEPGSVTALMGRNGAGKSTLLGALSGQLRPSGGRVTVSGLVPHETAPRDLVRRVGMVPQDAGVLLYADSVAAECRSADRDFGAAPGTTAALLTTISGPIDAGTHPRDLSEGQRLSLALAIILAGEPGLLLLDEPTRGLDYQAKARLVQVLRDLAYRGHTVLMATHDVEMAAEVSDRVVILAEGDVVADGSTRDILAGSPAFAPQVAKIVHPLPFLTVAEVEAALEAAS